MSPMPIPVYAWICATSCSLSILLSFLNGGWTIELVLTTDQ